MLLNAIVIILRETLEAGVLISVLMSIIRWRGWPWYWVGLGLLMGLMGAALYATQLDTVSNWFDYVGQEVVNASLQYAIYACLVLVCVSLPSRPLLKPGLLPPLVATTIALAVVREGAEIFLFYSAYWQDHTMLMRVLTSGFMGLTIGVSVGAICYYLLVSVSERVARRLQFGVLSLMAAGMVAQASQLLLQADWLPATDLWIDMSRWLPEASITGQLLYATLGYEATPSRLEAALYFSALLFIPVLYGVGRRLHRNEE